MSETSGREVPAYWVMGNRYGGGHWAFGADAVDARRRCRESIAESFEDQGCTPAGGRRAAST